MSQFTANRPDVGEIGQKVGETDLFTVIMGQGAKQPLGNYHNIRSIK